MIRNMTELLLCIQIGSNVNSLISSLQTAGDQAIPKLCVSQSIPKPILKAMKLHFSLMLVIETLVALTSSSSMLFSISGAFTDRQITHAKSLQMLEFLL